MLEGTWGISVAVDLNPKITSTDFGLWVDLM